MEGRPGPATTGCAWLLLAEANHRVANEYTLAVSSLSLAAKCATPEARGHLIGARDRLAAYADAHRAHLAPLTARTDLSEYLARLCFSIARAHLADREITLRLIAEPFEMASDSCWRVGLIVSELITNAIRHGAPAQAKVITVELRTTAAGLDCAVRDNGGCANLSPPGHGARIIQGVARELGGRLVGSFAPSGSCVVLSLDSDARGG